MQAAGRLGKMSFRAAIVVGNAVKNKIQHNNRVPGSSTDEDALNELMTSQIAGDESMDINATYSSALDEDPVSSPSRYVAYMMCVACRSYRMIICIYFPAHPSLYLYLRQRRMEV